MEFPSSKPQLIYFYDNDKQAFKSKFLCKFIIPKKVPDHGYNYNKMPNSLQKQEYFKKI